MLQSILTTIGRWKANSSNQVQGLHTCLGVISIWIAAHFGHILIGYLIYLPITAFLEFVFDPFFEPHPTPWHYDPDTDDFAFYQLGALLGYLTLVLFTRL